MRSLTALPSLEPLLDVRILHFYTGHAGVPTKKTTVLACQGRVISSVNQALEKIPRSHLQSLIPRSVFFHHPTPHTARGTAPVAQTR